MWLMWQAKLAVGRHEAALMHGLLPPAVLAASENSWRHSQAEIDPTKVCIAAIVIKCD